jgi:hypothetical protein
MFDAPSELSGPVRDWLSESANSAASATASATVHASLRRQGDR